MGVRLDVSVFTRPETLASQNDRAYAYRSAGRPGEAIPLYEQNFADRVRVSGPDHPDTLTSRDNLAAANGSAGQPRRRDPSG